jgi:hypothetical protein
MMHDNDAMQCDAQSARFSCTCPPRLALVSDEGTYITTGGMEWLARESLNCGRADISKAEGHAARKFGRSTLSRTYRVHAVLRTIW